MPRLSARSRLLLLLGLPVSAGVTALVLLGPDLWRPDAILAWRDTFRDAVSAAPVLSLAAFLLVYLLIISSALPGGPPMSLMAGFLFGRWVGTAAILVAATGGSVVVYRLARGSLGAGGEAKDRMPAGRFAARVGPGLERMRDALRANAFWAVLGMRLVPAFPFFLVNILCGLCAVPLRAFVLATVLGRAPVAFTVVSLGEEIGRVEHVSDLLSPRVALIFTAFGALALLPVVFARRFRPPGGGA